ncbi:hypothetical protein EJ02DRAFT_256764 [Clathrospora elynae]|uniref:C3H1-type domain-containing protein n=1 Tax=Clathrospora elynae TaxID=706981 RepID=A0A6A5SJ37_9PLEO|nr:hypothetical protein EJ02DRAFT_256764 [Clathrospora elynae]
MASNHVPSDQVPLQGQNVYNDPSYQNLFSSVDRYGTPTWEAQLHQQAGLTPSAPSQNWHHGSFTPQPYNPLNQSYGGQTHGLRSASPYQYGQFGQQGSIDNYGHPPNVDPSLGLDPHAHRQQQQSPYQMPMRNATPQSHTSTVTPQALQHNVGSLQNGRPTASPYQIPKSTADIFAQQRTITPSFVKPVRVPEYDIPKGRKSGGLYVLDQAALAKATKSTALNKFVTIGSESFHLATNRTALPVYLARNSQKDLKKAGADNKKLRAKIFASKSQSKALKSAEKSARSAAELKREASDSASSTESSDDDSEFTDDDDEQMPVPASRPEEPDQAVRYDVIKATWCPSASSPSSEKIKGSMRDVWEVLNTIHKRWRADTKAVTEAEEQKKTGELPVLKSRVTSQRDLLKSALEAALEFAHPDVLYHLGQIKPFLYLCYQFLANRFHSKDYDGPLSAVIYEVLSRCGTLTSELLEETRIIKALSSMNKHANEKHKAFIRQIVDGAATNSKKAKVSSALGAESTENKGAKRPATDLTVRSTSEVPLAKRPKAAELLANAPKKDAASITGSKTTTVPQKRPGERTSTAPAPVKTRVSQVLNKPSSIFASLTAASKKQPTTSVATTTTKTNALTKAAFSAGKDKKPGVATMAKPSFSFAQTMASLQKPREQEAAPIKSEKPSPAETPDERTKRLRKESRKHLRVTWRPDTSLVDIKYFDHKQDDEDMDHKEEHLVRDAGDIGGEGRMFKQHKELDMDEDDEDLDAEQRSWTPPSQVDFSVVHPEERKRNYIPFGGGEQEPSCPEKEANVRRENATLMVFYSHANDIPSSPREPLEQTQEATSSGPVINFGTPPDSVLSKCPHQSLPLPDIRQLESLIKQISASNQPPVNMQMASIEPTYTPPPTANLQIDTGLVNLLSALNNGQAVPPSLPPTSVPVQPPVQQLAASYDFASILAGLQAQAAAGGAISAPPPLPPPGAYPYGYVFPPQPQHDATAYQPPMHEAAAYQSQMQPQYNQQTNGAHKRQRDDGSNNADRNPGKRPKNRDNRPHKVLHCKFFQKGQCNKGENCTYIHDLNKLP